MSFQNLEVNYKDKIAVVTINRPENLNALNSQTILELNRCFLDLESNSTVRAIVLTGAGNKAFVAGADIKEFADFSEAEGKALAQEGQEKLFNTIEQLNTPVIAAINGFALGGGLELALCCDIRISSENSYVGLPETSLGIIPGAGGLYRLAKLIGLPKSKYWIFTAQKFNAESAYGDGVIDFMSKEEELLGITLEISQEILENAPLAIKASKTLFNEIFKDPNHLRELQNKAYSSVIDTEDKKEAIKAFLSKRKPSWMGK